MRGWLRKKSDMRRCRTVARVLQQHLDGELDLEGSARVAAHLEACHRCGMDAATYEELKERLHRLHRPVDEDIVARLTTFVDELVAGGT